MDPTANLIEQRKLATLIIRNADNGDDAAVRLAELVGALDEWITSGGFLPDYWRK